LIGSPNSVGPGREADIYLHVLAAGNFTLVQVASFWAVMVTLVDFRVWLMLPPELVVPHPIKYSSVQLLQLG
jgi:hypothetical protein